MACYPFGDAHVSCRITQSGRVSGPWDSSNTILKFDVALVFDAPPLLVGSHMVEAAQVWVHDTPVLLMGGGSRKESTHYWVEVPGRSQLITGWRFQEGVNSFLGGKQLIIVVRSTWRQWLLVSMVTISVHGNCFCCV